MAKIPHPHDALAPVAQANRRWNPIARRRAERERKRALAGRGGALLAAVGAVAAALTWRARHRHHQPAQPA